MKKWFVLLLVICFFPISTFAKTATKEGLMEVISTIQNVQVDDNIKVLSIEMQEDTVEMTLLENDLPEIRYIPYTFENHTFTFTGGTISLDSSTVNNNQYAFYLYSILESKSTAAYDEENYYNQTLIQERSKELTEVNSKKTYKNWGNTFGLTLERKDNQAQIYYHYYLDGDDIIISNIDNSNGKFTNPNTGNFGSFVTIALMLVIGLAGYTYWGKTPKKKMN